MMPPSEPTSRRSRDRPTTCPQRQKIGEPRRKNQWDAPVARRFDAAAMQTNCMTPGRDRVNGHLEVREDRVLPREERPSASGSSSQRGAGSDCR
jgi:hypothetical protein